LRISPFLSIAFLPARIAMASPATFVTALPVAGDQLLIRFNMQPMFSTGGFFGMQFPVNIGYGLTSRWTLFVNVNQGFGSLTQDTAAGPRRLGAAGFGDTVAYARYTLLAIDKPKSTFRIAPLAGAFVPTGSNSLSGSGGLLPGSLQTGSGTLDPYFGVAMGYNTVHWGMAMDSTYREDPAAALGISPGSEYRADAQVEFALYPIHLPEEGLPKVLVLSIESNYVHDARDRVNGALSPGSGGDMLKQDAVLELAALHYQVGAGAQIPVMQNLNGPAGVKERMGFFVFFEYYLAAPGHHGRMR
jgi:hypothetical protein